MAVRSLNAGGSLPDPSHVCCRCNRSGRCRSCVCCKERRLCVSCLPGRLGRCENNGVSSGSGDTSNMLPSEDDPEDTFPDTSNSGAVINDAVSDFNVGVADDPSSPWIHFPSFDVMCTPNFIWGDVPGETFTHSVTCCYDEVVHWRKSLFKIPLAKCGRAFVTEQARLFRAYATGSALECVAFKAAMIMPVLLLQRPYAKSKDRDHIEHLTRRLSLWNKGDIDNLVSEGRTLQHQFLKSGKSKSVSDATSVARKFSQLMMSGKVKDALRLLSSDSDGKVLPLDSTVMNALIGKHPKKQPPVPSTLIGDLAEPPHFVLFDQLDAVHLRRVALKLHGAAGPSGLDASAWRRMCTSFQTASDDLCDALSAVARRLCTSFVDPAGLSSFVACRLIALDKNPGVRPIGIGEAVRRLIAKAILSIIRDDIQAAAGPLQLCAGQLSGCEAAVHSMRQLFSSPEVEAVILVDASNAFNSLNRQAALFNIQHLCPSFSTVLLNTYRSNVNLYIGGETLLSEEGTTQGDPLAMPMYALGVVPLINALSDDSIKQVWYADDASACGRLMDVRRWWDRLVSIGPHFGYFPNPSKTCLIVKGSFYDSAVSIFQDSGVCISIEGKRHLGAALGSPSFVASFVTQKVSLWRQELTVLSDISVTQPHAAYAAFVHGVISKWNYLVRCIPDTCDFLLPLEEIIRTKFLPNLTGQSSFSDAERDLMALPPRLGGLGIINPVRYSSFQFSSSVNITAPLVELILQQSHIYSNEVLTSQFAAKRQVITTNHQLLRDLYDSLLAGLPHKLQRSIMLSSEKGSSSWLTALPLVDQGFALHKGAFRDALCLRYGWQPKLLPSYCVCGGTMSIEHALSCPFGGFPSIRHNELRDITAAFMSEICHNVRVEPTLQPLSGEQFRYRSANVEDGARLDVSAESFWGRDRRLAYFDIKVFNPLASTYASSPLAQCYRRAELDKKRRYDERIREVERGTFSPLVFSSSGGMGPAATVVYKRIATLISEKRGHPYSHVLYWLRCHLCFSLLRSAVMCLRGSRSSYHRHNLTDPSIDLACSESRLEPDHE